MMLALYEVEVIPGLAELAEAELRATVPGAVEITYHARSGSISFRYGGDVVRLNTLRSAIAVNRLLHFAVPRPLALLGHASFTRLVAALRQTTAVYPPGTFRS